VSPEGISGNGTQQFLQCGKRVRRQIRYSGDVPVRHKSSCISSVVWGKSRIGENSEQLAVDQSKKIAALNEQDGDIHQ
jgi:hypothetical protein